MFVECIIVYMRFSTTKYYITDQFLLQSNYYQPIYNKNFEKAKPFLTEDEVKQYKEKIHPHYRREYFTEKVMLPAKEAHVIASESEAI